MFERSVKFTPAYDKRDPDPKKDYGIGAMRIFFYLKGPKGVVQFVVGTGIYLPHTMDRLWATRADTEYNPFEATGWDIGYHSPVPMYEGQGAMQKDCDALGGECYYDGTTLGADEFFPTFVEQGDKAVWAMLEERYHDTFGGD